MDQKSISLIHLQYGIDNIDMLKKNSTFRLTLEPVNLLMFLISRY